MLTIKANGESISLDDKQLKNVKDTLMILNEFYDSETEVSFKYHSRSAGDCMCNVVDGDIFLEV